MRRRRTQNDGLGPFIDGDFLSSPMQFADHETDDFRRGRASTVHDGRGGAPGHRPGFCFSTDAALRDAADASYEERRARLSSAPVRKPTSLADAQADAERAYAAKVERLRNAYKGAST